MIPADLATRLRVLIDTELKPLVPIQEVASDLPDLEPGQRFSATLDRPNADGTFRALVAGRTVTLSMPQGAKAGDILDLVVTGRNDKTITAKLADVSLPPTNPSAPPPPKLSAAGQLISQLLTGGQSPTRAAELNRNEPLLPTAPNKAAVLAPILRQAVRESGLFYESHQAQWLEGENSIDSLLREPQARTNAAPPPTTKQAPAPNTADKLNTQTPALPNKALGTQTPLSETASRLSHLGDLNAVEAVRANSPERSNTGPLKIPEQLMPLVHQQLETLATHQVTWQGQVWPGQTMQWDVYDPETPSESEDGEQSGEETAPWQSTLKLSMPRLGGIEAQLIITSAGVAIRMTTDSDQSAAQLQQGGTSLSAALEAAGVPMTGFVVSRENAN